MRQFDPHWAAEGGGTWLTHVSYQLVWFIPYQYVSGSTRKFCKIWQTFLSWFQNWTNPSPCVKQQFLISLFSLFPVDVIGVFVLNVPVRVFLLSEQPSAESGWAATAGCWGSRSCLPLRFRWSLQSSVAMACVPERPKRRGGEVLESVSSATRTLPPENDAGAPQLTVCGRREQRLISFNLYSAKNLNVKLKVTF